MSAPVSLLHSLRPSPDIRARLHTVCALYARAAPDRRTAILDYLETLTLQAAALLAEELLDAGWRPDEDLPTPAAEARLLAG